MMLFACKCLNVTLLASATAEPATPATAVVDALILQIQQQQQQANGSNGAAVNKPTGAELQFLKKAIGPIDAVRVTVQQPDLIRLSHVGFVSAAAGDSAWQLAQCVGCDAWTHATSRNGQQVLINPETMTNDEDIKSKQSAAHYSTTFGLLLDQSTSLDRDQPAAAAASGQPHSTGASRQRLDSISRGIVGAAGDLQRHPLLTRRCRDAVQREIEATDERIRAFTERQFAQLRAFRERTQTEYEVLAQLARTVEQPALPNRTRSSSSTSSTASNPMSAMSESANRQLQLQQQQQHQPMLETPPATPDSTPMSIGNSPNFSRPQAGPPAPQQPSLLASSLSAVQRAIPFASKKISPLRSMQQSPQQQTTNSSAGVPQPMMGQSYGGGGVIEHAIDAFYFEMDGAVGPPAVPAYNPNNSYMSDVEESDSDDSADHHHQANEAHASRAIPRSQLRPKNVSIAQSMPISMPAVSSSLRPNSGVGVGGAVPDDIDDGEESAYDGYAIGKLDDGVDIAASIKALARSVHGDAVFGDLPRPRFSTQI